MKLTITSDYGECDYFIGSYLLDYIADRVLSNLDYQRIYQFDKKYNIDFAEIIQFAVNNLDVNKTNESTYIIGFNKNLKYKRTPITKFINLLTYGSRDIRGYSIILDEFKYVDEHIDDIYRRWKKYGN